jgi:hypothetical protein
MNRGIFANLNAAVDISLVLNETTMTSLMNMPMKVILTLVERTLMNRNVSQDAIKLLEIPPHQDLLEVLLKVLALTIVVITKDQSLLTIQSRKHLMPLTEINITKMIDDIVILNRLVPALYHMLIHMMNVTKLSKRLLLRVDELQNILVPKMRVADNENFSHRL